MIYFYIGLILYLLGGLLSIPLRENYKAKFVASLSGLGTILVLIPSLSSLIKNTVISQSIFIPEPIGAVNIVIDPLSAFFVAVIAIMSFIGTLYTIGYIKPYLNKDKIISSHFFFLSILIISMLLVVTIQNALAFLIAWEIMSLSSFFLVIFENEKKEVIAAGINYLITMHISVLFLIIGFILITVKSGSYDFNTFKQVFESNSFIANLVFSILFVGFGIKAGFVPFHTWLPKAHPAAPSHISGMMSGIMIKTGIYGILRILFLMNIPSLKISYSVLLISGITALFGILYATAQKDIKKLLAYSSIENIGIIGIGIGVGMLGLSYNNVLIAVLGFSGAILHILNHSIFKELLFFSAGAVYKKTHLKNIEKLGGIIKKMPYTSALFLTASIAICALPPFNGFISEFLIYIGLLHNFAIKSPFVLIVSVISIASLALVGTIAILCFTKAFSIMFLGLPRCESELRLKVEGDEPSTVTPLMASFQDTEEAESAKNDVSKTMLFPMGLLASFIFLIGLFPQYALMIIKNPVMSLLKTNQYSFESLIPLDIFKIISLSELSIIALFLIIFAIRTLLLKNKKVYNYKTWACGYQNGNNRMQYTASSYAAPFLSFLKPFFIKEFDIKKPNELFPKEAYFKLNIKDIVEFYLINPVIKTNKNFIEKFYWIQSGNTQQYILYGLLFLIIALIGTIGVK